LRLKLSLYEILQILSVTVFEKIPIFEEFSNFSDEFPDANPCLRFSLPALPTVMRTTISETVRRAFHITVISGEA
jgi:hypothetical protein